MSREDRLAEILEVWERAVEADRPIAPEEACAAAPDLLPEFITLLGRLGRLELGLNGAENLSVDELAGRLRDGRYTPVKFHASGGLGLVFLAEDRELNRAVALKCLQGLAELEPSARGRFLAEAEITGRLEHPGIVPVYGFGRDSGGRPYYAMRFIRGVTLAEAVDSLHALPADSAQRSVEFRRLLRSFISVCQTIAYSHSRGFVHRDLKPANVMLGPFGETLVVDWGLAKAVGTADAPHGADPLESAADGSQYGRAKGSPAFMAPEQARGEWHLVGTASDIYSLGSTLYVLLTGQKPYPGAGAAEVIEAVKRGRFAPPRARGAGVPKPLEAICLKAMAHDPAGRYGSARELADDLDRWAADEPVSAWREPLAVRARRWLKRHRTGVATALATAGVSAVALGLGVVLLSEKNAELGRKNHDLEIAYGDLSASNERLTTAHADLSVSNARVEENLKQARRVTREMTEQALGNPLLRRPGMAPAQHALLKISLGYYKTVIALQRPDDAEVQEELAFAHYAVAISADGTGNADEAAAEFERANALFRAIRNRSPGNHRSLVLAATASQRLGVLKARRGDTESGLRHLEDAVADLNRIAGMSPAPHGAQTLKLSMYLVSWVEFARAGRAARAAELRAAAVALLDHPGDDPPDADDETRLMLAVGHNDFGAEALRGGRLAEAQTRLSIAAKFANRPGRSPDAEPLGRWIGSMIDVNRAELFGMRGKTKEALELCGRARQELNRQAHLAGDIPADRLMAAKILMMEGRIAYAGQQFAEAEGILDEARGGFEKLCEKPAPDPEAREGLAQTDQLLGIVLRKLGKSESAMARCHEADRLLEALRQEFPGNSQHSVDLVSVWNAVGILHLQANNPGKAEAEFDRARVLIEDVIGKVGEDPRLRHHLGVTWGNLGRAKAFQKSDAGLPWAEKALAIHEGLVRKYPDIAEFAAARDVDRYGLAWNLDLVALDSWKKDNDRLTDKSLALMERAQPLFRAAAAAPMPPPDAAQSYEGHLRTLGTFLRERAVGDLNDAKFADAVRLFEKAVAALETLVSVKPADTDAKDKLQRSRVGLILACQGRIKALDSAKDRDRQELIRTGALGLATVDKLSPDLHGSPEFKAIVDEIRARLAKVPPEK